MTAYSSFLLDSETATKRLAVAFGRQMRAGDVLLLNGGLAAGKTFFVRAVAPALGITQTVSSPTYTLANIYNGSPAPVLHIDAYRIESSAEFADLALEDELERSIVFIEWGAALEAEFENVVSLELSSVASHENKRNAALSARGVRGNALLKAVWVDYVDGTS